MNAHLIGIIWSRAGPYGRPCKTEFPSLNQAVFAVNWLLLPPDQKLLSTPNDCRHCPRIRQRTAAMAR